MAHPDLTYDHILSERHAQHSHLTSSWKKGPTLTSDLILSERISTYIWSCVSTSHRKGSALTSNLILSERHCTYIWHHLVGKDLHLHLTSSCQKGSALTSNLILLERCCTYIWSCGNQSLSHIRMDLCPRLSIPGNWPGASIPRMEFSTYIWSWGTNPTVTSEWISTHIWHGRNP